MCIILFIRRISTIAMCILGGHGCRGFTLNNIISTNVFMYSLRQKFIRSIICSDNIMTHLEHPMHVIPSDIFYLSLITGGIGLYMNDGIWKQKYRKLQNSMSIPDNNLSDTIEIFVIVVSLVVTKDVDACI